MGDQVVTVYGVRGESNNPPFNQYVKESLKGRLVTSAMVDSWLGQLRALESAIEAAFLSRQSEMLDPLHDPMRIAKQVNTIANRLIQQEPGAGSYDDKLDRSSFQLKSLVKASGLLTDSFDLLAIYFNPAAAEFGSPAAVSLHGLLVKLVSIFRIDDGGFTQQHQTIYFSGECFRNVFVRESFKLIPFSLLANAVKYSLGGAPIRVTISDHRTYVEVSVESTGPLIEQEELEMIFQKRGRGKWAKATADGRGVGLYLAATIAAAHGFAIQVSSRATGHLHREKHIPLAVNRFWFQVPVAAMRT
jgi:hypothetical protein